MSEPYGIDLAVDQAALLQIYLRMRGVAGAFVAETLNAIETYSIAFGEHNLVVGNHWHANAAGDAPGLIPLERAEIGGWVSDNPPPQETCRGFSQFSITGKYACTQALLKLQVRNVGLGGDELIVNTIGGVMGQETPYEGNVDVVTFSADGTPALSDFDAAATATLSDAFDTTGAIVDQEFSVDITTAYNALIAASADAIGIRLQTETEPSDPDTAITFYNVRVVLT